MESWHRQARGVRLGAAHALVAALLLVPGLAIAQAQPESEATELPRGQVIPRVACEADPEQTYALYLPSYFRPGRSWPLIFLFEPAARGTVPVELVKEAAEKYGYLVAASNNSRNGPFQPQFDAAVAVTRDVNQRFPVNARRVYFAGFSGGARMAAAVAQMCSDCAAGVVLNGAGFPQERPPGKDDRFPVFILVGTTDFNYADLIGLQGDLDRIGVAHRLRRFDGTHEWAPASYWMEAVEWLELLAMKDGRRERDATFVEAQLSARLARVRELEKGEQVFTAWEEYRDIARDFAGLADVGVVGKKAEAMAKDKRVREGQRAERREIGEQERVLHKFNVAFNKLLEAPGSRPEAIAQVETEIDRLWAQRNQKEQGWRGRVAERCHSQVTGRLYEAGELSMRHEDFAMAAVLFELLTRAAPDVPWPFFHLARARARAGKEKETVQALDQALQRGMSRADLLDREDFQSLRGNQDFERIREALRHRANPPAAP